MSEFHSGVGELHVGDGPVGGSVDDGPVFVNLYPHPGASALAEAFAAVDVIDYDGDLDVATVVIAVNGVIAYSGGSYKAGFVGTAEDIPQGRRYVFRPDGLFYGETKVSVFATDLAGHATTSEWSWSSPEGLKVARIEVLSSLLIRVHFNAPLLVDEALYEASNFAILVRAGAARAAYVGRVAVPNGAPLYVNLHLRDHLTFRGNYALRVRGIRDVYGREVIE